MLRARLVTQLTVVWHAAVLGTTLLAADEPARPAGDKAAAEQVEFFEKEVLPILTTRCFKCHGGEEKIRGGLRLTTRGALLKGGDQGKVVELDTPDDSLLLKAINYDGLEMPPTGKLPASEIAVLSRWVKLGVPWGRERDEPPAAASKGPPTNSAARLEDASRYWAYRKVQRPAVPVVQHADQVRNAIDSFLLEKLEARGLTLSAPADRVALIRRAYYDLVGLPPRPEEVDAFVKDSDPLAYERLIDRLLASPQYGEKWGRHWLDLVRYAETNGYERDTPKPLAWRYRDYVIDAFNEDKPYDVFLREQLAGDELDEVTPETMIATGYYRLGIWDDEPADRLLAKYDILDGIVSTTAQVVLGTTVGCARCHDHKKDPIPQRDYYRLLAYFRDITDMTIKNTRRVPTREEQQEYDRLVAEKRTREERLDAEARQIEQQFSAAFAEKTGSALVAASDAKGAESGRAVLLPDSRRQPQTWQYTLERPAETWTQVSFDAGGWKSGPGGFGAGGATAPLARTRWNGADIWLRRTIRIEEIPVALALDAHHIGDAEIYLNGTLVHRAQEDTQDYRPVVLSVDARAALKPGENVIAVYCHQRRRAGGQYIDVGLRSASPREVLADRLCRDGREIIGPEPSDRHAALAKELEQSRSTAVPEPGIMAMCVETRGREATHVLIRGNPNATGERVEAGVPAVLDQKASSGQPDTGGRRRALAEWLTSPENPLTARVLVNRLWQHHFGRGIVPTPNDFGQLGEPPTHPELLDWLAAELVSPTIDPPQPPLPKGGSEGVESKIENPKSKIATPPGPPLLRGGEAGAWRLKRMHRLIMLSNAYRMSARANPRGLEIDPANTLFWRFNMRRLSAEEVRDSILAVSGTLNLKAGGPGVYPPIPKEVLAGQSRPGEGWPQSPPDESARRSVYVHVKRSLLVPILAHHDQADTDSSCPVRYTTTVPTQALGMLNGDFTHEQARELAMRLRRECGDDLPAQIARAIRLTASRRPGDDEAARDAAFVRRLSDTGLSAEEALRHFCLLVLNANEFLYLD